MNLSNFSKILYFRVNWLALSRIARDGCAPCSERVDDIPLIIGLANKLHLAEVLDHYRRTHRLQQGSNNGHVASWAELASILSQADHRIIGACGTGRMIYPHLGIPAEPPDRVPLQLSDDRLGGVLEHLPS